MTDYIHPYDQNSLVYNFLFHPLHRKSLQALAAVITQVVLTILSIGLWQIPFWIVNYLDARQLEIQNNTPILSSDPPTHPEGPKSQNNNPPNTKQLEAQKDTPTPHSDTSNHLLEEYKEKLRLNQQIKISDHSLLNPETHYTLKERSQYDTGCLAQVYLRKDSKPLEQETPPDYLKRVFKRYETQPGYPRGFVFSGLDFAFYESKQKHPHVIFLEQYIQTLKDIGIQVLYLEQFYDDADRENERIENSAPFQVYKYLQDPVDKKIPSIRNNVIPQIVQLAKKHGLQVFPLESRASLTAATAKSTRLFKLNTTGAIRVLSNNLPFAVFVGTAHGKRRRNIPGISDYLDCPAIGIDPVKAKEKWVKSGTHRFTAREYSADAVITVDASS